MAPQGRWLNQKRSRMEKLTTPAHRRSVVSYVRRSPRMTPSQRVSLDAHSSRWVIEVERGEMATAVAPQAPLDLVSAFGRRAPLIVEIGCGHGDALAAGAAAHPQTDFLGFEVFDASIGATLGKIAASGVENVRLVAADAVGGLTHLLAECSVVELWVFFPDPWPKKRHHKRRLVNDAFADLAHRVLAPGGVLRLATDWQSYAEAMAAVFDNDPRFELTSAERFDQRPLTKFETRGINAGRAVQDFAYTVRPL